MNMNIGFIGAGNMGAAMIRSIVKSGLVPATNIYISDVDTSRLEVLKQETGVSVEDDNEQVVMKSDIVVLAVKPNVVKNALEPLKDYFDGSDRILVSIAVGLPIKLFKSILGSRSRVIRTMPNTPAMVGEGMTLVSPDNNIKGNELENVMEMFRCLGKVEVLDERLMSEVTALTGSSPAYVYMFIEAMADAAVLSGIPRAQAYRLAAQAVLGSAKMVLETGKHPGELKDQVCSPAGTTIEAVASLERNGLRFAVMDAMDECSRRAREIGRMYDDK